MAAVVGGAVAFEWGDEGTDPEPGNTAGGNGTAASTSSTLGPIKEAPEESVCRIISHREAEALVGHELPNRVVELPLEGAQCSWPDEPGKVVGQLYLVVKQREEAPLGEVVRHDWQPNENFTFEPVPGLGDEAIMVIKHASADTGEDEFAVGLDVHVRDLHVILGNGARDLWEGTEEAKRQRLRDTMATVLDRFQERLKRLD